ADPIQLGPHFAISSGGNVYPGQRVEVGWPLCCLTWREEGDIPINKPGWPHLHIVATRVSVVAAIFNLTFVGAAYVLVVVVAALWRQKGRSAALWLVAAACIAAVGGIGWLSTRHV